MKEFSLKNYFDEIADLKDDRAATIEYLKELDKQICSLKKSLDEADDVETITYATESLDELNKYRDENIACLRLAEAKINALNKFIDEIHKIYDERKEEHVCSNDKDFHNAPESEISYMFGD